MEKLAILCLLSVSALYFAWAESDCKAKIDAYNVCLGKIYEENPAQLDDLKAQLEQCYNSNGCQVPADRADQKPKRNRRDAGHGLLGMGACPDQEQAKDDFIQKCIENCAANAVKPFKPPQQHSKQRLYFKYVAPGAVEKACPADKQETASGCVNDLVEKHLKQAFESNCGEAGKCQQELGDDCKKELRKSRNYFCTCDNAARGVFSSCGSASASSPSADPLSVCKKPNAAAPAAAPAPANDNHHGNSYFHGLLEKAQAAAANSPPVYTPCGQWTDLDYCAKGYDAWRATGGLPRGGHVKAGAALGKGGHKA